MQWWSYHLCKGEESQIFSGHSSSILELLPASSLLFWSAARNRKMHITDAAAALRNSRMNLEIYNQCIIHKSSDCPMRHLGENQRTRSGGLPWTYQHSGQQHQVHKREHEGEQTSLPELLTPWGGQGASILRSTKKNPTQTDHHPLEHKLGLIRTLQHRAESVLIKAEGKNRTWTHKASFENLWFSQLGLF